MVEKRFVSGRFVRIALADGSYGYGRLRESPIISFYDLRTEYPISDIEEVGTKPILFTVVVHKSVLTKWEVIGKKPLEERMKDPFFQFWQDIGNFRNCRILDNKGNTRPATPEECKGLERWAVWEAEHVEQRLLDTFMGRPNPHLEHMKVKDENHPSAAPAADESS